MKKFFLMIAAAAAMTFAACTSTADNKNEADNKEAQEVKVEEATQEKDLKGIVEQLKSVDTEEAAQGLVAKAEELAQKLAQEGKLDEAKKYLTEVKDAVAEKYPAVATACETALTGIEKVAAAEQKAEETAEAAKNAVESTKEAGKAAVESTKEAGKATVEAGKAAVENTKEAAHDAVEGAKSKVNDVVNAIKK